jgi:hypothetical protein
MSIIDATTILLNCHGNQKPVYIVLCRNDTRLGEGVCVPTEANAQRLIEWSSPCVVHTQLFLATHVK